MAEEAGCLKRACRLATTRAMAVVEALCLAGDLIVHGTAQAPNVQDDLAHGSSVGCQAMQNTRLTPNGGFAEGYAISANDGSCGRLLTDWPVLPVLTRSSRSFPAA